MRCYQPLPCSSQSPTLKVFLVRVAMSHFLHTPRGMFSSLKSIFDSRASFKRVFCAVEMTRTAVFPQKQTLRREFEWRSSEVSDAILTIVYALKASSLSILIIPKMLFLKQELIADITEVTMLKPDKN